MSVRLVRKSVGFILPGFLLLWIINVALPLEATGFFANFTQRMWLGSIFLALVVSLVLWVKLWFFDKKQLLIGILLGILVWNPVPSIGTFFAYYASFLVFRKSNLKISLVKGKLIHSLTLGIAIGIPLAVINILLSGESVTMGNPLLSAWVALNPGIHEEIIFRFFIYAICVYLLNGEIQHRRTKFLCLVLMVFPHVMLHFPDMFIETPEMMISGVIVLSLLFGLPMALLQLRRDLVSAIALHWFIDFIRFWLVGIPGA